MGDVEQGDEHGQHGIDDLRHLSLHQHTKHATGGDEERERHHEHYHALVNVAVGGGNGHILAPKHGQHVTNGMGCKAGHGQQPQD